MTEKAEHRVQMHRLATERRAAGLPVWERTIHVGDVFDNEELSFEQQRDGIVARLRASGWYADDGNPYLCELVELLATAEDPDEFDEFWNAIFDEADQDRVWIEIRNRGPR